MIDLSSSYVGFFILFSNYCIRIFIVYYEEKKTFGRQSYYQLSHDYVAIFKTFSGTGQKL